MELKVNVTYQKVEKLTTNFETLNEEDVINKTYLHEQLFKKMSHLSKIEKQINEFKSRNRKLSEKVSIERALKTTVQILYDTGLFDNCVNADEVSKKCVLFNKVNERRRSDLEEGNDVIQWFYS